MPAFFAAVVFGKRLDLAVDLQHAAIGAQPAKQRAREFELAAAHEAVDAEHFAGPRLERDVAIGGRERQPLGAQRRPARRGGCRA